jgi:hypothetical protein
MAKRIFILLSIIVLFFTYFYINNESYAASNHTHKYVLTKHPFCLKFTEEEVLALKKVYGFVKQNADFSTYYDVEEECPASVASVKTTSHSVVASVGIRF